jgi:hypothetical protein
MEKVEIEATYEHGALKLPCELPLHEGQDEIAVAGVTALEISPAHVSLATDPSLALRATVAPRT